MKLKNPAWTILLIICIGTYVVYLIQRIYGLSRSDTIAFAQVVFSVLALMGVLYNLYVMGVQLRKSMAKPRIKVAFNERGEQRADLTYRDGGTTNEAPRLWLINEGNAISRYFQIDFIIPESIGKPSANARLAKKNGWYVLSYMNEADYTLFINRPYSDPRMVFFGAIDVGKCIEVYRDSFKIPYRIYGDWAETQEGELTITLRNLDIS